MNHDFITIGGATEDITFYTKEGVLINNKEDILRQKLLAFEYGAKIKIDKSYSTYGGGAANAAVSLALLGFKVAALVSVGQDPRGEGVLKNFSKFKIDTDLAQKQSDAETGFSFLLVAQNNEHVVFSNRASNSLLSVGKKEIQEIKSSKWVYMTSLSGKWKQVLKSVFASGTKIAWNPGHIQLSSGYKAIGKYLKQTEILIVNKDEAIELVVSTPEYRGKDHRFLNNSSNLMAALKEWGPKIVVVTNGKHGAGAFDGENYYYQKALNERKRMDTTGVGDAFGSTFTAGIELFEGDIEKALHLGARNSASVIGEQGAQNGLLKKSEILSQIKE